LHCQLRSRGDSLTLHQAISKPRRGGIVPPYQRTVDALGLNDTSTDAKDRVVFHTLRHTFASWLAIRGTPLYTIQRLMGHKSIKMTERYAHLCPDVQATAVETMLAE